jgi:hypothetical protein
MIALRACQLWCLTLALAVVPLRAEEQKSSTPFHAIADGTTFFIRLETRLNVSQVRPGKRFKAKLVQDLVGSNETIILHGRTIKGHVSDVGNGFHPRLLLSFDEIETDRGWAPLMATVIDIPGEHGLITQEEGAIERRGQGSDHHDPDSDGIGAKAGAAAGVVRALFIDHRLELQKGTTLEVRLDRPLPVPWH